MSTEDTKKETWTYSDATDFIWSTVTFAHISKEEYESREANRLARFFRALGDQSPFVTHPDLKVVHIAGTNGKGSTAAMTAAAFQDLGFNTGLFTSPHLHTVRERCRINGKLMSRERFAELLLHMKTLLDKTEEQSGIQLTVFDRMTMLALMYFAQEKVEWAVMEVGMGGQLDSTNCMPDSWIKASLINHLSLEHTNVLGNTIQEIAMAKAGIMRPNVPVFTISSQVDDAMAVLHKHAQNVGTDLTITNPVPLDLDQITQRMTNMSNDGSDDDHSSDKETSFQDVNRGLVVAMFARLFNDGILEKVDNFQSIVAEALINVKWFGRLELLPRANGNDSKMESTEQETNSTESPSELQSEQEIRVLIDCAHNPGGVKTSLASLTNFQLPNDNGNEQTEGVVPLFCMGCNRDKDVTPMLRQILAFPQCQGVVLVKSSHPKALSATEIVEKVNQENDGIQITPVEDSQDNFEGDIGYYECNGIPIWTCNETNKAVDMAQKKLVLQTEHRGLVVVLGSVFLIADVRQMWFNEHGNVFPEDDWVYESVDEPVFVWKKK